MEGHLRGIVGQLSVEEIVKQPEMVADKMRLTSADDMAKMGLEIISFTIKEVRDKNEYIINMGKPDIAANKRNADIAAAEAARDTAIRQAMAQREAAVARAQADQERVIAETASATKQAAAQRDLDIARAEYTATVQKQKAAADKAYEIEANVQQQAVVREQVGVERVAARRAGQGAGRRNPAPRARTDRHRAEAGRDRAPARGNPGRRRAPAPHPRSAGPGGSRPRATAAGQADAIRVQGLAEADVIRARGQAEADAMQVRAAAFKQLQPGGHHGQAADQHARRDRRASAAR